MSIINQIKIKIELYIKKKAYDDFNRLNLIDDVSWEYFKDYYNQCPKCKCWTDAYYCKCRG